MADAPLPTTRVTLLARLRQDPTDQDAWDSFVERYGRHIYRWCRRWRLQDADAEDDLQPFITVEPRPGMLLLWESWLRHEVLPGSGGGERLSISFNFA